MEVLKKFVLFFATPGFWISAGATFVLIAGLQYYISPYGRGRVVTAQLPGLAMMSLGFFGIFYMLGWWKWKRWPQLTRDVTETGLFEVHRKLPSAVELTKQEVPADNRQRYQREIEEIMENVGVQPTYED